MNEQLIDVRLQDGSTTKFSVFSKNEITSDAVAILFPAMGTAASYYYPFAKSLAEKGFTAITADLRGIGHSGIRPKRGVDFGFNEMLELDYKGILEKVDALFPGKRKFIIGHSLGGILASLYLSKYPKAADGLILIAACNIYYKGWSGIRKWWLLFGTQMMNFFATLFGYHAGNIVGFGGIGAKTVIKDWSYTARTGKYRVKNSTHDFERNLKNITPNVLAVSFKHDILAPGKAVDNLLGKFNSDSNIVHKRLADVSPGKPYSHYNWVRNNDEVIGIISDWKTLLAS
jgi:predicted alpha/beta hydrolase